MWPVNAHLSDHLRVYWPLLAATSPCVFEQGRPLTCQTSRAVMRNRSSMLVLAVCEDALDGLDVLQEGYDNRDVVL